MTRDNIRMQLLPKTSDSDLQITDLGVDIKSSRILRNVTFSAVGRNLLAIMGPSGSGKTTLMNAIAGRQSVSSGAVTLDGRPFTKSLRRRLGLVLQEDVFFPTLTLWETLYFTAMVRIPDRLSKREKVSRLKYIMKELDIESCKNTVFGDIFTRGLSGGEKKRASIACELLTDPDILLLDEPTSGLDSSMALSLVRLLKQLSVQHNRIVITCIHQPSNQMYYMFDSLLLLAQGQVAYFGGAKDSPLDYFSKLGYKCQPFQSPADFFIQLVKENSQEELEKFFQCARKQNQFGQDQLEPGNSKGFTDLISDNSSTCTKYSAISIPPEEENKDSNDVQQWPTGFVTQFRLLTWRNLKLARANFLPVYEILYTLFLAVLVGVIFNKIPNSFEEFRNRMGVFYFSVANTMFIAVIQTILNLAGERSVIARERSSGCYRMSAYFLSKNVTEMVLVLILPTVFYTGAYWLAELNDVAVFFKSLPSLLLAVLFAQGLGYLIGAAIHNTQLAMVAMNSTMMTFLLASGFITEEFPPWLQWLKYCSIIHHAMSAMTTVSAAGVAGVPCNSTKAVQFTKCALNSSDYVTADDVLLEAGIDLPIYCYISTVAIGCVLIRIVAYVTLRMKRNVLRY